MKKIILIGDSIRMGYDKYVKDALDGVAQVLYPEENCKFAVYVLRFLGDWRKKGEWGNDADLVHWNAGLWDLADMNGEGPLTDMDYYGKTVARINRHIKRLFPKAKIVFATSTSVVESGYGPGFKRTNRVIEEFNSTAIRALEGSGTVINDLYRASVDIPDSFRSDMTHFNTNEGRAYMGNKVLSVICRELDIDPKQIKLESFVPEDYTDDNIGY